MMRTIALISAAFVALSVGAGAQDTKTGTLSGTITFAGDPPPAKKKKLDDQNAETCKCKEVAVEDLLVDKESKGIANVVIEILECGEPAKASEAAVEIDQKGCIFNPHLVVVSPGTPVILKNSDEVLHNVKSSSKLNVAFNEGIPAGAQTKKTFASAEKIKVSCDVHPWMSAWVVVSKNTYRAVTDAKGAFEIKGIPAGKYRVRVWHETLGTVEKEVEIAAGGAAKADFEMKKEKK